MHLLSNRNTVRVLILIALTLGCWQSLIWAEDHNGHSFGGGGIAGDKDDDGQPPPCDDDNGAIDDNDNDDCDDDRHGGGGKGQRKGNFDFENCPPFNPDEGQTRAWFVDEDIKQEKDNTIRLPLVLGDGHFEGSGSSPSFRVRAGVDVHYMPFECLNDRGFGRWRYWRDLMGNIQLKSIDGSGDPKVADWWAYTNVFNDDGGFYYKEGEKIRDWVGIDHGCRKEMHWGGGGALFSALPSKVGFCKYEVGFDPDPPPQGNCLDGQASPNQPIIDVEVSQARLIDDQGFISGGFSAPLVFIDQDDDGLNDLKNEYYEFKVEVTPPGPGYDLGSFLVGRSDSGPDEESYIEIMIDDQKVSFGSEIGAKESQSVKIKALYSKEEGEQADPGFFLYYNPVDPVEYFGKGSRYGDPGDPHSPPYFSRLWVSTRISDVMAIPLPLGETEVFSDENEQAYPDEELVLILAERGYQSRYYESLHEEMEIDCALVGSESGKAWLDYETIYSDENGVARNRLEMPGQVDQSVHHSSYQVEAEIKNLTYKSHRNGVDVLLSYQLKEPIVVEYGEVTVIPGTIAQISTETNVDQIASDSTSVLEITGEARDLWGNLVPDRGYGLEHNDQGEPTYLEEFRFDEQAEFPVYETDSDGQFSLSYKASGFPNPTDENLEVTIRAGQAEHCVSIEQLPVELSLDIDKEVLIVSDQQQDYATCHVEVKDSQGNPVADGTPLYIFASHGRLETLEGEWIGLGQQLSTLDGKFSFLLKGSHARHDPDEGILLIVTCASRSPNSYAKTRVKVIRENDLILHLKGPALIAGDETEDSVESSDYIADYQIDIPIPASTQIEVLGPPNALVEVAHASSQAVLCYSCDVISSGQSVPDECNTHHATSHGAQPADLCLYFDGAAWLETAHHRALSPEEFRFSLRVNPEDKTGSLIEKSGEYHLAINEDGTLNWEVITDQGAYRLTSSQFLNMETWNDVAVGHYGGQLVIELNGHRESADAPGRIQSQGQALIWAGNAFRGYLDSLSLRSMEAINGSGGLIIEGIDGQHQLHLDEEGRKTITLRSTGTMRGDFIFKDIIGARLVDEEYGSEDDDDDDDGGWFDGLLEDVGEMMPAEVVIVGRCLKKGGTKCIKGLIQLSHSKVELGNEYGDFDDDLSEEEDVGEQILHATEYVFAGPGIPILALEMTSIFDFLRLAEQFFLTLSSKKFPDGVHPRTTVVVTSVVGIVLTALALPSTRVALKTSTGLLRLYGKAKFSGDDVLQRRGVQWCEEIVHTFFHNRSQVGAVVNGRLGLYSHLLEFSEEEVDRFVRFLDSPEKWEQAAHFAKHIGADRFKHYIEVINLMPGNTKIYPGNFIRVFHGLDEDLLKSFQDLPLEKFEGAVTGVMRCLETPKKYQGPSAEVFWSVDLKNMMERSKGALDPEVRIEMLSLLGRTVNPESSSLQKIPDIQPLFAMTASDWILYGKSIIDGLRETARRTDKGAGHLLSFEYQMGAPEFTMINGENKIMFTVFHDFDAFRLSAHGTVPFDEFFTQAVRMNDRLPIYGMKDIYLVGKDLYTELMAQLKLVSGLSDDAKQKLVDEIIIPIRD